MFAMTTTRLDISDDVLYTLVEPAVTSAQGNIVWTHAPIMHPRDPSSLVTATFETANLIQLIISSSQYDSMYYCHAISSTHPPPWGPAGRVVYPCVRGAAALGVHRCGRRMEAPCQDVLAPDPSCWPEKYKTKTLEYGVLNKLWQLIRLYMRNMTQIIALNSI